MKVGGSGGGYFYGPFVSTQSFGTFVCTPGIVINSFGAWAHLPAPVPTGRGRWLEMAVSPADYGCHYRVEIGIGALGSEVSFQPSDGQGFHIDWFSTIKWIVPFRISFPTSVGVGREFSVRCASVPGGGADINVNIWLWN
jgi:hypothetical protein